MRRHLLGQRIWLVGPWDRITLLPIRATLVSLVSRLLLRFFQGARCEFLEARIIPKRIEHRIEPEQRRSERARRERASIWDRE